MVIAANREQLVIETATFHAGESRGKSVPRPIMLSCQESIRFAMVFHHKEVCVLAVVQPALTVKSSGGSGSGEQKKNR